MQRRLACPEMAGAQDLLDGAEQAVAVVEHGAIELLALGLVDGPGLQGFQIQADGGDRGLQLVRDRVDEGVVLGVARISRTRKVVLRTTPAITTASTTTTPRNTRMP